MRKYLLIFILSLLPIISSSQDNNSLSDSIVQLKKKIYEHKNSGDFEKAMITLNSAVKLCESIDDNKSLVDFYNLYIQLHIDFFKSKKTKVYMTMSYSFDCACIWGTRKNRNRENDRIFRIVFIQRLLL